MADISQYLQDILDAVYGEQVRGSIHDAIEIINEASEVCISAGTVVSSVASSSEGFFENSLYINTNTYDLWKCIGINAWSRIGNLQGNGIASLVKTSTSGNVDTYTITFDDGTTETFDVTNGIDGTNGSIWYKGTALTGTGMAITGFPGVINDFYLNSDTGGVYVCTKTGGAMAPDAAEWDYVMTLSGGGGGSSITVINNLNSASTTDALSANMGRVLKGLVDQKQDAGTLAQVATSGSYNDLSDTPNLTVYATKTEIVTWVDTTLPSGQTTYSIASPIFKTTSRIVQVLADGGGKYKNISIPTDGLFTIEFPSALTAGLPISIGISNATGETPTP